MTPAERLIREEIAHSGPLHFRRFMEIALYHPEHGYYRRPRDPFGKDGDFFTAQQLQPVFGILIERTIRQMFDEMGRPDEFAVVELGAGRGEMHQALEQYRYIPVERDRGEIPRPLQGVVFANELFDALPVDVFRWSTGGFVERVVGIENNRLAWLDGPAPGGETLAYLARMAPSFEEGQIIEVSLEATACIGRIAAALVRGYVMIIDYGYTRAEMVRHLSGTLMSYRRHLAEEDVLQNPGERDITAHVPFTMLAETAVGQALECVKLENLASTLLRAGESDQFQSVLDVEEPESTRRRLQLKTLLFGMGETFRTLLLRRF